MEVRDGVQGLPQARPDDLQFVENVLKERAPAWNQVFDRRGWLNGLAAAAAGSLAGAGLAAPVFAQAPPAGDTTQSILDIADTAEHLAVTYLGYVIAKAGLPANVDAILAAARYEEQVHLQVLESLGAKPLTTSFSLPGGDLSYVTNATKALQTIVAAEGLFVAAYLAAVADFSAHGNWKYAQYCAEIMGVEAEHRALARFALGDAPANDRVFEVAAVPSVGAAAAQLSALGFLSPTAGNSYAYPGPGAPTAGAAGVAGTSPTSSHPAG